MYKYVLVEDDLEGRRDVKYRAAYVTRDPDLEGMFSICKIKIKIIFWFS